MVDGSRTPACFHSVSFLVKLSVVRGHFCKFNCCQFLTCNIESISIFNIGQSHIPLNLLHGMCTVYFIDERKSELSI